MLVVVDGLVSVFVVNRFTFDIYSNYLHHMNISRRTLFFESYLLSSKSTKLLFILIKGEGLA